MSSAFEDRDPVLERQLLFLEPLEFDQIGNAVGGELVDAIVQCAMGGTQARQAGVDFLDLAFFAHPVFRSILNPGGATSTGLPRYIATFTI